MRPVRTGAAVTRTEPPASRTGARGARAGAAVTRAGALVTRARERLRRHPRWIDAGVVVLVALLNGPDALTNAEAATWLCFAAVHAPLVWRRRAPVPVFWLVYGLSIISALLVGVRIESLYPESVVAVAIYTVARYGPRRHLWPIIAVIEVPAVVILLGRGPAWTGLYLITLGLAAVVLLGVTVGVRQAYLAELAERARRLEREREQRDQLAVAAERARIARELHDIVAHNLAVMVALADGAAYTASGAPERAAETMRQVSETGRQALGEMRRLLGLLRADTVGRTPQPGLGDLDTLLDQVRAAGLPVELTVDGTPGAYGPGADLAVYRVVQEALTNTLKHAGPQARVSIKLRHHGDGVDVEIVDDGAGRTADPDPGGGHGLTGMIERVGTYGGDVEAGPRADRPGWRVHARLRFGAAQFTPAQQPQTQRDPATAMTGDRHDGNP